MRIGRYTWAALLYYLCRGIHRRLWWTPHLQQALAAAGVEQTLPDDRPLRAKQKATTYLTNHADKMDYPQYRREGLPTTSSLIESQRLRSSTAA